MAKKDTASQAEVTAREMEADPFDQPYWNFDQYLIWLASRDPAAVLKATDRRPNAGPTPPLAWCVYEESNVDRQNVEREAVRAIKGGYIQARVEFNGRWSTPHDPKWFADWVINSEGEPTFAALLIRSTKHGRREKIRLRFNPESIARRYPAPTPSNVRDRPDVENPDVGPFVAYYDAWRWLADCISLERSLPIEEAGTLAEKTIRDICMNTPEKLTMWGFRQGDPDAELKAVTPQAWQALSINPLAGQPEADLKAVGYRREYGAATKGEDGPGIWTSLCFDRRQFVAAIGSQGGHSETPAHMPATRAPQPRARKPRGQPLRERARRALAERFPDGVPDQITKSNAELISAVKPLINKGGQAVSDETILRAAGRLK